MRAFYENQLFGKENKTLPVRPTNKQEIANLKKKNRHVGIISFIIGSLIMLSPFIVTLIYPLTFVSVISVLILGVFGALGMVNGLQVFDHLNSKYSEN